MLLTINDEGLLHSGADYNNVGEVCASTVYTLGQAVSAVIGLWQKNWSTPGMYILAQTWSELTLTLQRDLLQYIPTEQAKASMGQ
jgi:hypothetical protein